MVESRSDRLWTRIMLLIVLAFAACLSTDAPAKANPGRILFVRGEDIWIAGGDGTQSRKLIPGAGHYSSPRWSPDGKNIAFIRKGNLWLAEADGGKQTRITTFPDPNTDCVGQAVWAPNGRWIFFIANHLHRLSYRGKFNNRKMAWRPWPDPMSTGIYVSSLWFVRPNGKDLTKWLGTLEDDLGSFGIGDYVTLCFSPDGTRMIASRRGTLWLVEPEPDSDKRLDEPPGVPWLLARVLIPTAVLHAGPSACLDSFGVKYRVDWSPDGKRLAYDRYRFEGSSDGELWTANADGTGATKITTGIAPCWADDGKIVFWDYSETDIDHVPSIWVVNADGSGRKEIIPNGMDPDWHE